MRGEIKALGLGIMAGIILLSLIVSMDFVYVAPRTAVAYVTTDNLANIALIPNDNHLQSPQGYFAFINKQGNLQINFGNVAPNSAEELSDVFYIRNNLNQPVQITITITPGDPSTYYMVAYTNVSSDPPPMPPPPPPPPSPPPSPSITLPPGGTIAVSLVLVTGPVPPGTTLAFTITVTAAYNVGSGQ
ncbi:hypothetical protein [Stygiolobus caldivivus]|uniref:DUF1102 domain-containing protein n=1 Tax=Stygiolobus caldivivus TaxID=2824673 RepID=A0A8D5U6H4_9CREN|nr:hypothetical protein [Stygiolobus caldivivus]BCU69726.1 hypothetical protein KN1_10230 [Stygiolobus caldivivus]